MKYDHQNQVLIRGSIFHNISSPLGKNRNEQLDCIEYWADGALLVKNGKIEEIGEASKLLKAYPEVSVEHYPNCLLVPGFIDAHVHYPQLEMIGAPGESLLDWLNKYTFPTELKYSSKELNERMSQLFVEELLRNGTTSAMVFTSVFEESCNALFAAAQAKNMRLAAGKVLMNRNAPSGLLDQEEELGREATERLIEKWRGKDRLSYALLPRFAPTCTEEQLQFVGDLMVKHPDVLFQTHLSEDKGELAWVKQLFPKSKNYVEVYDSFGLLGKNSSFAHCIYLNDDELALMAQKNSKIVSCPTSNFFLGSGCFDIAQAQKHNVVTGLGTDVGGGTSMSMLTTMAEGYKAFQFSPHPKKLSGIELFYLATLGSASALNMDTQVGNFKVGKEADLVALNLQSTPYMAQRFEGMEDIAEKLFLIATLGGERMIKQTYINGKPMLA